MFDLGWLRFTSKRQDFVLSFLLYKTKQRYHVRVENIKTLIFTRYSAQKLLFRGLSLSSENLNLSKYGRVIVSALDFCD